MTELNLSQQAAVNHKDGALLILAGAGSGKTRVLTERYMQLRFVHNIAEQNILMLTFSRKAMQELRARLREAYTAAEKKMKFDDLEVYTFNSFGNKIVQSRSKDRPQLISESKRLSVISFLIQKTGLNYLSADQILRDIDLIKSGVAPENVENSVQIKHFYDYYQKSLTDLHCIDFNDQINMALQLLKNEHGLRMRLADQYKYIMIDEAQDTNALQFEIIKMLTLSHQNVCVVGDDDQCIYRFRGADPSNLLDFQTHYADSMVLLLDQNFRSSQVIVDAAAAVIANNKKHIRKNISAVKKGGELIEFACLPNALDEVEFIYNQIALQGITDVAILVRNNSQLRDFQNYFDDRDIAYVLTNQFQKNQRPEIRLLLDFIIVIQSGADASFERILQHYEIDYRELLQLRKQHNDFAVPTHQMIDIVAHSEYYEIKISHALESIYKRILSIKEAFNGKNIVTAFAALLKESKFIDKYPVAVRRRSIRSINKVIVNIIRHETDDSFSVHLDRIIELLQAKITAIENENAIKLMTIHSSKGLEFESVYIPGCEAGILPSQKNRSVDDERNLFYVAMTRAKDKLTLTMSATRKQYTHTTESKRSPFVDEIPHKFITITAAVDRPEKNQQFVASILKKEFNHV